MKSLILKLRTSITPISINKKAAVTGRLLFLEEPSTRLVAAKARRLNSTAHFKDNSLDQKVISQQARYFYRLAA